MTVDFTDWVKAWREYRRKKSLCSMLLLAMMVVFGAFAVTDMGVSFSESDFLLFASFALLASGGAVFIVKADCPDPFIAVACRRFHNYSLEGDYPFPEDRLPEDGMRVTWLDDGEKVEGRLFVDGTRVTLAPYSEEVG